MNIIRAYNIENIKQNEIIYQINDIKYYFYLNKDEALIKYDNINYLDDIIKRFKNDFGYINKIYNKDNSFYQEFDHTYIFRLPIKILQPSKHILCEDYLNNIKENYDYLNKIIKVALIDDEYVILNGHTLCYEMLESGEKMVDVYLREPDDHIRDFVYIAKEYNINDVTKLQILPKDQYDEIQSQINMMLNS